jgi:hypothetical protein
MAVVSTDLKWYYSGGSANADANASLGGEISSVEITSNLLQNLFDNVSAAEASAGSTEYRCAYLKNTNGADTVNDMKLWISSNTPSTTTRVDIALDPAGIGNGVSPGMATTIADETTAPSGVSFANSPDPVDASTAIAIGNLTTGECQAVWFRRVVDSGTAALAHDPVTVTASGTPA